MISINIVVPLSRDHPQVPRNGGLKREVVFHQGDNIMQRNGLKHEVVSCQDGLSRGGLLYIFLSNNYYCF